MVYQGRRWLEASLPTVASLPAPLPLPPDPASARRPRRAERSGLHARSPPARSHAERGRPPWLDRPSPTRSLPVLSCASLDRAEAIARPVSGGLVGVGFRSLDVHG